MLVLRHRVIEVENNRDASRNHIYSDVFEKVTNMVRFQIIRTGGHVVADESESGRGEILREGKSTVDKANQLNHTHNEKEPSKVGIAVYSPPFKVTRAFPIIAISVRFAT